MEHIWLGAMWKVNGKHREMVYVRQRVFGAASAGNHIPCQTAQAKAERFESVRQVV